MVKLYRSHFFTTVLRTVLRVSGNYTTTSCVRAGVGMSSRAGQSMLDWFPTDNRLCFILINRTVKTQNYRGAPFPFRCFCLRSHCSSIEVKDKFYGKLSNLLQKAELSDVVIVACNFGVRIGKLKQTERHLGGYYGVDVQRTDNGDRLLQWCSNNRLFLVNIVWRSDHRLIDGLK